MREYVLLQVQSYNMKKPNEFDKYKLKTFNMSDKLKINQNIELVFDNQTLKAKLESVVKEDDVKKIFCINTNKWIALIQVSEYYNNNEIND